MVLMTFMHTLGWIFLIPSVISFTSWINVCGLFRYIRIWRQPNRKKPIVWDLVSFSWPFDVPKSWNDFASKVFVQNWLASCRAIFAGNTISEKSFFCSTPEVFFVQPREFFHPSVVHFIFQCRFWYLVISRFCFIHQSFVFHGITYTRIVMKFDISTILISCSFFEICEKLLESLRIITGPIFIEYRVFIVYTFYIYTIDYLNCWDPTV